MQTIGLLTGLATFVIIAAFHPLVVQAEYLFSQKAGILFLFAGGLILFFSFQVESPLFSAVLGVLAFTCFWSIKEIYDLSFQKRKSSPKKNGSVTGPRKKKSKI